MLELIELEIEQATCCGVRLVVAMHTDNKPGKEKLLQQLHLRVLFLDLGLYGFPTGLLLRNVYLEGAPWDVCLRPCDIHCVQTSNVGVIAYKNCALILRVATHVDLKRSFWSVHTY